MSATRNITTRGYRITTRANNMNWKKHGMAVTPFQIRSCDKPAYLRRWRLSERLMPAQTQTARLDKLFWASLEDIGYGRQPMLIKQLWHYV